MTNFLLTLLTGAENKYWMMSQIALRGAVITGDLSMPELLEVLANIVAIWPLIVSYLKETGKKYHGDSLMV